MYIYIYIYIYIEKERERIKYNNKFHFIIKVIVLYTFKVCKL